MSIGKPTINGIAHGAGIHYRGAALRAWTKAIHTGETIEVRVVAEITSSSDETVEKRHSFGLHL